MASASKLLLKRRSGLGDVKNRGGDPSSGTSSVDVLIPTERHPACRQREARPGCRMERENLAGDAKGKRRQAARNREAAKVTDAPGEGRTAS